MRVVAIPLLSSAIFFCRVHAAFITPKPPRETNVKRSATESSNTLDVVLFGIGDLRTDDHLGLYKAVQSSENPILPVALLNDKVLQNIPGSVAHLSDTAKLVEASLSELNESLQQSTGLTLHTVTGGISLADALNDIKQESNVDQLRVHVCDLGIVDNKLGYGAFAQIDGTQEFEIIKWHQNLREEPWMHLTTLSDKYTDYEIKYAGKDPIQPLSAPSSSLPKERVPTVEKIRSIPSAVDITNRLIEIHAVDVERCEAEASTGLYQTHWGGLPASSVGCLEVLKILDCYVKECNEDDVAWSQHPAYIGRRCKRNGRSLEHASMIWQLRGDGKSPVGYAEHWLAGESMVRYLAAPLLLGTVSPRRVWHSSVNNVFLFTNPLKRLVEGSEWHRLLAAHRISTDPSYAAAEGKTRNKYWRYHGFLCRYVETDFEKTSKAKGKEGVLLVHGFGASGSQWNKAMLQLSSLQTEAAQGLAPDLIGFGEAEKPALSYTGYMWDSMVMDFCKEVAISKNGWTSCIVGGNSIGGYTSMSFAACDRAMVQSKATTSSGAPGTGICSGVVLMNSAGPLKSREEVELEQRASEEKSLQLDSVAQVTALDALPASKPLYRPAARAFGNVLLSYLRPRIQSICKNLYPTNPDAVDDILCNSILRDSLDPGAINVMMAGAKLPPPRSANELLGADFGSVVATQQLESLPTESYFDGEVLIAQGVLDPLNDATDRMNRFGALRNGITADPIQAGHCPHDELPQQVAKSIAAWMEATKSVRSVFLKTSTMPSQGSVPTII